jgi:phospholipid/cholesterol/gamma-HCH transport system substrate-binding protein
MRRNIGPWRVAINGGFALVVLALAGFGLHRVAGRHWKVQPTFRVRAEFATIGGVEAGHRVRIQGIDAGVVERVVPPSEPGRPVELVLRVDERLHPLVRTDAVARIISEGLVGAKVVELTPGRPDAPPVAEFGRIASERPIELADVLRRASGSLERLDTLARSAEQGLSEINTIAGSIRRGEGSLGKLVSDETIYRDLLALSRRGERALTALEENLTALKQTWPISRYFDRRAYLDRERVLFQPGSQRNSRSLQADEIFEPGRSVLTPIGRSRLDEIARWCKQASRPGTQVVIAAFTDDDRDQDLAEILTQDQADAVRNYLVTKHSIQSAGWFKRRKIASVGFGSHAPRTLEPAPPDQPARRVEIILFTPQA